MTRVAEMLEPLPRELSGRVRTSSAPAKINLALHVVGRRDDGYHELDGLLLPLAWADTLTISLHEADAPEVACVCENRPELSGPHNLAAKAASAWLSARGLRARIRLRLTKEIWVAAGLGGGSSDAAATLWGLESIFAEAGFPALGASRGPSVEALALALGADVPFFLDPRPARVRGVGEILTPLLGRGPEHLAIVLLNPGRPLATSAVYSALKLARGARPSAPELPATLPSSVAALAALIHNDLEVPATRLCPAIALLREALTAHGALAVGLTGSGPTVFGLFDDSEKAAWAATTIPTIHGFSSVSTTLSAP